MLVIAIAAVVVASASGGSSNSGTAAASQSAASSASNHSGTGSHHTSHGLHGIKPVARGTGVPGTATVPILMYHVIDPPSAGAPFPGLYVPAPEFAAQMQALKGAGWHAVT